MAGVKSWVLHCVCTQHAAGRSQPWPLGPSRLFLLHCWPCHSHCFPDVPGGTVPTACQGCMVPSRPGAGLCTDAATLAAAAPGSEQGQPRCRHQEQGPGARGPSESWFPCPTATSAAVLQGPGFNSPHGVWPQQGKCGRPPRPSIGGGCLLSGLKAEIGVSSSPKQPFAPLKNTS